MRLEPPDPCLRKDQMPESARPSQRSVLPIPDREHVGVRVELGVGDDVDHLIGPDEQLKIAMVRQ